MSSDFTESELEAYLDESLDAAAMAAIEAAARQSPALLRRLAAINERRNQGVHTLGEMWRRHRLSCPTREQMGSYLLGAISPAEAEYIQFHIETIGCRYCAANVEDLRRQRKEEAAASKSRRTRYFESSAGYFRAERGEP